jgi:hypothetical protein
VAAHDVPARALSGWHIATAAAACTCGLCCQTALGSRVSYVIQSAPSYPERPPERLTTNPAVLDISRTSSARLLILLVHIYPTYYLFIGLCERIITDYALF